MRFFSLILVSVCMGIAGAQQSCPPTPMYSSCELVFELPPSEAAAHPKPWESIQLHAEFRSPKAKTYLVPAYWDGARRFVIRFAPDEAGDWTYRLTANFGGLTGKLDKFSATASESPGWIRPANRHHWQFTENLQPHLWMGVSCDQCATMPAAQFDRFLEARAAQKFTHVRIPILPAGTQPDPAYYQELDRRLKAIHSKGMIADLVLGGVGTRLTELFPTWQDRERYLRYVISRYTAFNVTWEMLDRFEDFPDGRILARELGLAVKKLDPFLHPRSCGAAVTSSPLLGDAWVNYVVQRPQDDALGTIEHLVLPLPQVNIGVRTPEQLWNATMNGQHPTMAAGDDPQSGPAAQWTAWFEVMSRVRWWDTEPYFDVDGGRAIAVPDTEYFVYADKGAAKITLPIIKHDYVVWWIDPSTGQATREKKEYKAESYTGAPPDATKAWILHLSRDGRKEGMARSYKFESWNNQLQEVEISPEKVPYEWEAPPSQLPVGRSVPYALKLKRETRGTRKMMFVLMGEVVRDGQGPRWLASGISGNLTVPKEIVKELPAVMTLKVYGLNALGKVYSLDHVVTLQ